MADTNPNFLPADFIKRVINESLLLKCGERAIVIIKRRTLAGSFLPGSSPNSSQYSTTPLPLPFGVLKQKAIARTWRELKEGGEMTLYTNLRTRRTWIILKGGYKKLRQLAGKETDHVTLNWSGQMLKALNEIKPNVSAGSVTVGFTNDEAERIARYHQELGAGKSRTLHKFLGLSDEELKAFTDYVEKTVVQNMKLILQQK